MRVDKRSETLRKNLLLLQGGRPNKQMALIIGANTGTTWKKRIEHPETMTIAEAEKLCDKFCLDFAGLFAKELRIG